MTSVSAQSIVPSTVPFLPREQFKPEAPNPKLIALGEGPVIRGAGKAISWTMGALMKEAAKRGITTGSPQAFKQLVTTQAVQSIERLTAAQMQDPRLVTSLILGARVGGHTIGKLAVGAGVSTASIAAIAAAAKQVGSVNIVDKRNGFVEFALGLVGLDAERGNTVDEAKIIKYNQLYNQYLPKFERAEQEWKKAHPEGVQTNLVQAKPVNVAKLKADLGKLGLSPQKIDKLLMPMKPAQLSRLAELTPWVNAYLQLNKITQNTAVNIILAERNSRTLKDELPPNETPPSDKTRREGCYTVGEVIASKYQIVRPQDGHKFEPALRNIHLNVRTYGTKNGVPAKNTQTKLDVYDAGIHQLLFSRMTAAKTGIQVIYDNVYLANPLTNEGAWSRISPIGINTIGVCQYQDGSKQIATPEVNQTNLNYTIDGL